MKDNQIFESHLISLYENAINESDEKKEKKENPEVEKFKESTVKNPKTGNKVKVSTVLKDPENPLHDKVKKELDKVKASAEGGEDKEDKEEEENPEENIKALTQNIEDERVAIEASKNKIKDLEKQKKASTDPDSFDKAIQKEKTRIEQGEEDIKEMKAKKEAEKKKIASAPETPSKTEEKPETTETPEEKPETTETPEEKPEKGEGDEGEGEKDTAKIEALKKEIDKLESVYDSKKEATQNRFGSLAEKTDSLATNGLLEEFVKKERAKAKAEFNEKILSFLVDAEQKTEIQDRIKEENARAKKIENELDQAQKAADEKNADDPKYQEAKEQTAGASGEDVDMTVSKSEDKPKGKSEEGEKTKSPEEAAKEQKKKEIDYNLEVLTTKIEKVKSAADKAKADGKDEKVLAAINKNYEDMKKAIDDLKSQKEKLGESFDSIELEIWALDVAVTSLLEQIETGYLFE